MAEATKDLYAVLGVARGATEEEIRRAYRRLAHKHHPDKNPGNKEAEERFKRVSAANEVLSDPKRRQSYDEFGEESLRTGFDPELARAARAWGGGGRRGVRGAPSGGVPRGGAESPFDFDLGDLFGEMFGGGAPRAAGGRRRRAAPQRREYVASVEIDLVQAIRGAEVQLSVPERGNVTVRIPPGVEHGTRLRVPGHDDVTIETHVRPHPFFRREGLDLHLTLPVTLDEAYSGAVVDVPTADGEVKLRVPPRSQQGKTLRLRGKGVERAGARGDLYVSLDVRLPDRKDAHVAEALRATGAAYSRPVREGIRL